MPSHMTRVNITLPTKLVLELDDTVGPRRKSACIAEALRQYLDKCNREARRKALEEGYKATRDEGLSLTEDFTVSDLEGWDEADATW